MCREMRVSMDTHSTQFDKLTYEQGVIAAVKWIFFDNAQHPSDTSDPLLGRIADVQREVMATEHAQARESGSEG